MHHAVPDTVSVLNERNLDVPIELVVGVVPLPLGSRQVEFGSDRGLSSLIGALPPIRTSCRVRCT